MSYNEVLDTPVRDLFVLRDIYDEIRQLKEAAAANPDPNPDNGGEQPSEQSNQQY